MKSEIGSYFCDTCDKSGRGLAFPTDICDSAFTFCGRTAIETVLENLREKRKAQLPAYCCDSMIEPFRRAGKDVSFYDVSYQDGMAIDCVIEENTDILLWCNYFGFHVSMPEVEEFLSKGGVIIEDMTHSLFSDQMADRRSTYMVASLRKWDGFLCGGYCSSRAEPLKNKPNREPAPAFLSMRDRAMAEKREYLEDQDEEKKKDYLFLFREADRWLAEHFTGTRMDARSEQCFVTIDAETIRNRRRRNADILYNGLREHPYIKPLFPAGAMDCPLFFPVIIEKGRDQVRKKLTENRIYCPVHWPHPKADCSSNLYDMELSLICDQRYGEEEMARILSVLNEL